ncbi:hypothetical protein [Terrisporobacter mayombei]|uniref:Uncharacterized protein n=1 Tax=Terrisporobacter mayombei TaxID=1541 RepID=A0ABY9PYW1_9FIRM|nr:hypothetical protein [Terrisporobacter mayombei]MCC3866663.1 hypothetical protein [Terrisporobacter mayombei]WMT80900.1 hypothetical protein TEMA_12230 [Terrisporobacter mayombei]
MDHIYPDKSHKKKIRGQSRKFKDMENNIIELTSEFPKKEEIYEDDLCYEGELWFIGEIEVK